MRVGSFSGAPRLVLTLRFNTFATPTFGLRYAYATEVEKTALKEAVFNTMLLKTLQRALEALEGIHGHALYAKGFLDLGIRANVILGELAQALTAI